MELRVTASSRSGEESDRSAKHGSVHGITQAGDFWAVEAKVEGSNSRRLREGAIVRFWGTKQDADADAAAIREGSKFYKDTGRRYLDPAVRSARAYWKQE